MGEVAAVVVAIVAGIAVEVASTPTAVRAAGMWISAQPKSQFSRVVLQGTWSRILKL